MSEKTKVQINESYNNMRKSLNNLNVKQSSGPPPKLYPKVNTNKNPKVTIVKTNSNNK